MEMCEHNLNGLFLQLGLLAEVHEIELFASSHSLLSEVKLVDAPFWSPSQRQFLIEALERDSAWSDATDQLARMLIKIPT